MQTKKTIELNLPKLPKAVRKGFTVPNLTNNLVSVAELADTECGTYFHKHGVEIDYEGEILWGEDGEANHHAYGEYH